MSERRARVRTQNNITESEMKGEKRVHEENKKEQSEKEENHEARKEGEVRSDKCCRQAQIREDH